jgi:hypothetical protein
VDRMNDVDNIFEYDFDVRIGFDDFDESKFETIISNDVFIKIFPPMAFLIL